MKQQSQNTSNRVPRTKHSVRHILLINLNNRNEDKTFLDKMMSWSLGPSCTLDVLNLIRDVLFSQGDDED